MSLDKESFSKLISSFNEDILEEKEEKEEIINEEEALRCLHCKEVALTDEDGYTVCNNCGIVIEEIIDKVDVNGDITLMVLIQVDAECQRVIYCRMHQEVR